MVIENKHGYQGEREGGKNWEFEIDIYTSDAVHKIDN